VQITADDIRRFQEIWREEFAEEITAEGARAQIARLDAYYLFLARRTTVPAFSESEDTQHQ
jgi:hypothetical protein